MKNHIRLIVICVVSAVAPAINASAADLEFIRVGDDKKGFVLDKSGKPFVPWGFNYDHDEAGRLIEDYWEKEWPKVEEDFGEMKQLGANVVRIHIQFGKFMDAGDKPNERSLAQLSNLLALAEKEGLYIDLTGLGCYHKGDVPKWYDELDEAGRWAAQARFWEAVAQRCAASPAIFCYDLMNEPVVPGSFGKAKDWLGPAFGDKHFVQYITLEGKGRERPAIGRAWIETLVAAIRKHDRRHLVTVGLVPWSLDRPGLSSGFVPERIAEPLDFICVHIYPESDKLAEDHDTLKGFNIGKPVVVEETFPLKCSADELGKFMDDSKPHAAGWIGFYWGKTPDQYRAGTTIADAITLKWLELFEKQRPKIVP